MVKDSLFSGKSINFAPNYKYMAIRKVPNTKRATNHTQQIALLQNRGVVISDMNKAKECLADIGYY